LKKYVWGQGISLRVFVRMRLQETQAVYDSEERRSSKAPLLAAPKMGYLALAGFLLVVIYLVVMRTQGNGPGWQKLSAVGSPVVNTKNIIVFDPTIRH
jgi:hypothetical protein